MDKMEVLGLAIDILAVIGGSGILAAIFPNASRLDGALLIVRKVLDVLAANVGNAKNQD